MHHLQACNNPNKLNLGVGAYRTEVRSACSRCRSWLAAAVWEVLAPHACSSCNAERQQCHAAALMPQAGSDCAALCPFSLPTGWQAAGAECGARGGAPPAGRPQAGSRESLPFRVFRLHIRLLCYMRGCATTSPCQPQAGLSDALPRLGGLLPCLPSRTGKSAQN